ncbi:hypothetical protein RhiLY_09660 [Ceratobasidium sp. AG-Ba]|nr:hypothetical protein RhiLY_09660 [Ceratobasidium sp. AG-Ba]
MSTRLDRPIICPGCIARGGWGRVARCKRPDDITRGLAVSDRRVDECERGGPSRVDIAVRHTSAMSTTPHDHIQPGEPAKIESRRGLRLEPNMPAVGRGVGQGLHSNDRYHPTAGSRCTRGSVRVSAHRSIGSPRGSMHITLSPGPSAISMAIGHSTSSAYTSRSRPPSCPASCTTLATQNEQTQRTGARHSHVIHARRTPGHVCQGAQPFARPNNGSCVLVDVHSLTDDFLRYAPASSSSAPKMMMSKLFALLALCFAAVIATPLVERHNDDDFMLVTKQVTLLVHKGNGGHTKTVTKTKTKTHYVTLTVGCQPTETITLPTETFPTETLPTETSTLIVTSIPTDTVTLTLTTDTPTETLTTISDTITTATTATVTDFTSTLTSTGVATDSSATSTATLDTVLPSFGRRWWWW